MGTSNRFAKVFSGIKLKDNPANEQEKARQEWNQSETNRGNALNAAADKKTQRKNAVQSRRPLLTFQPKVGAK